MLAYLNNWVTQLTAAITAEDELLPLGSAADLLQFENQYYLTLTESLDPLAGAPYEIIMIQAGGAQFSAVRGAEDTTARAWPAGTFVYMSLTAGVLSIIVQSIEQFDTRLRALEANAGGGGDTGGGDPGDGGPL
jgi:hypothetical protein